MDVDGWTQTDGVMVNIYIHRLGLALSPRTIQHCVAPISSFLILPVLVKEKLNIFSSGLLEKWKCKTKSVSIMRSTRSLSSVDFRDLWTRFHRFRLTAGQPCVADSGRPAESQRSWPLTSPTQSQFAITCGGGNCGSTLDNSRRSLA